ncbi:MAG: CHAT domain-containing protein [Deltaproteobacteria bacterium]|nr:CHAT domain-containing protein [Deltaproteobacteria bacterium]
MPMRGVRAAARRICEAACVIALLCGAFLPSGVLAGTPSSPQSCQASDRVSDGTAQTAAASKGAAAEQLERSNTLVERGEYAAALAGYEESERLARESGDAALATLAAANGARAAVEAENFEAAGVKLERALGSIESLSDTAARAQLLIHVGRTYALLGERDPAARRSATRRAADVFQRALEVAKAAGDTRLRSFALGYLGELYEHQGLQIDASGLTRRAIHAAELADAPDALYRWQWQLGRIEAATGQTERALGAYRDTVATLRDIRTQTALSADAAGSFQSRVEPIYTEFVDLLLAQAAAATDSDENQALLVEARDALEDLKVAELRDYFRDSCLDAQRKTAPDAIPNTIVIYPVLLPDRVELIVSRDGRLESHRLPIDRDTLIAEVRAFREALERRNSRHYLALANTLYDWMIRPIESVLQQEGDPATLVFVPDGALRTIPFAALRDRESKRFLIEMHPIAVTPSLTLTNVQPFESDQIRMLAAGISESVEGYSALPAVGNEIAAVREFYPGKTLMNGGFQVEALRSELTDVPYGIVHIASHGEFGGEASDNFLLAYDGRVSMDQLAAMVGATRFRAKQPLELLTLSACESAAGDDRAALGLAGVALRAGARSAVATLWSVNDQATAEFVVAFYRQLNDPEQSRAQALQYAQIELLSTRHYRHPGYWAPYLLINSWL